MEEKIKTFFKVERCYIVKTMMNLPKRILTKYGIRNLEYGIRNTERGFTLLEALITIVVLVVGVVVLLQVFSIGMFADAGVENTTIALNLAQEKMEEIKDASSYAGIDSFIAARVNLGGDFADFDREVTVSGDPKQVNVVVYWTVKGEDQNMNLVTLFADYDY